MNIQDWSPLGWLDIFAVQGTLKNLLQHHSSKASTLRHSAFFICSAFSMFHSVTQSCPTLCNSMDCSKPGSPVHHQLPELIQIHVHQISDAIQPSHPPAIPFSCLQIFPASGSFQMSQFFPSGGQSIGSSASVSVIPVNIQSWFPLGLTGLIS